LAWVQRSHQLRDELTAAQQRRGTAYGRIDTARREGDYDEAVRACSELDGAERLIALVEGDIAAHDRSQPGRLY
jgi:hypothetical protein